MLFDRKLQFIDGAVSGTPDVVKFATASAKYKLGANRHGAGYWNLQVNTAITASAASSFKLQTSADGSTYADVPGMLIDIPATGLAKGAAFSLRLPEGTKQYLKLVIGSNLTAGAVCSYLGDPIAEH